MSVTVCSQASFIKLKRDEREKRNNSKWSTFFLSLRRWLQSCLGGVVTGNFDKNSLASHVYRETCEVDWGTGSSKEGISQNGPLYDPVIIQGSRKPSQSKATLIWGRRHRSTGLP